MKKMLLMFFVLAGFVLGINAGKSELEFSKSLTKDERLVVRECVELLRADPDKEKTVDGKHWLLLKQFFSLSFLESRMTQQSEQDNSQKFNVTRFYLRQNIRLLRDEEQRKLDEQEKRRMKKIQRKLEKLSKLDKFSKLDELNFFRNRE